MSFLGPLLVKCIGLNLFQVKQCVRLLSLITILFSKEKLLPYAYSYS